MKVSPTRYALIFALQAFACDVDAPLASDHQPAGQNSQNGPATSTDLLITGKPKLSNSSPLSFSTISQALQHIETQDNNTRFRITWDEGTHRVDTSVHFPPSVSSVSFKPGAHLELGPRVFLYAKVPVTALGTQDKPIHFSPSQASQPWGAFAIYGSHAANSAFDHCVFEGAHEAQVEGESFRGALSISHAPAKISNSVFQHNEGDDGLSLAASRYEVSNCTFVDNQDGIDVDEVEGGHIQDSEFRDNSNDAIDIGERSEITILRNTIVNSGDKAISIGEESNPTIHHNVIAGSAVGIGIKDSSDPEISFVTIYGCKVGVASFEAIDGLGPGQGRISNSIIWNSIDADVELLGGATTAFSYSCIQSKTPGTEMLSQEAGCADPLFASPENFDFHLQSQFGHWDDAKQEFVTDSATSPCIDRGTPALKEGTEPVPNGHRVNLGAFGGTTHASRSAPEPSGMPDAGLAPE